MKKELNAQLCDYSIEKIFDKQGNLIGYKVPNNNKHTKKRKKEFSNIWIKLKENKNENTK